MSFQRRPLLSTMAVVLATMLGGCASALLPRQVSVSEAELQAALQRRFPLDRQLLEVLDVQVSTPRLRLLPDRNRLALALDLGATDRLFGRQFKGRLAFDAGLRFEPADATLRLAQVQVTELSLQGGGGAQAVAERLGAVMAERLLENIVVHQLSPQRQQQLKQAGLTPGPISVTAGGLQMPLTR